MVLRRRKKRKKSNTIVVNTYEKKRCLYTKDGMRCKRRAYGGSQLCKKHGGVVDVSTGIESEDVHHVIRSNSKYRDDKHPVKFIDFSRSGLSMVEIAAKFNVSVGTIEAWAERYKMMGLAVEIGKALHEAWWLSEGKAGLTSRSFNTSLFKFLTGNKLGYSERVESKNLNMNVNAHGVLAVPQKVGKKEWSKSFK